MPQRATNARKSIYVIKFFESEFVIIHSKIQIYIFGIPYESRQLEQYAGQGQLRLPRTTPPASRVSECTRST